MAADGAGALTQNSPPMRQETIAPPCLPRGTRNHRRRGPWFAACLLLTRAAAAEDGFALRIQPPTLAGCPSREAIEQALRARDLTFHTPPPGAPATELRIEVRPAGERLLGSLDLLLLDGNHTQRELHGATCEEVTRSLSLVAALALAPLHAAPASPPPAPTPPTPPTPPASTPVPRTTTPPRPPAGPTPPPSPPSPPSPPGPWSAGVEVGAMSGLGPRLSPGVGLWIQRNLGPLHLRLGAGYWPHGTAEAGPFRARFTASLVDLVGCLARPLGRELEGAACGGLHAGVLEAQGQQIDEPRAEQRPWLAPRVGGRLRWSPETGGLVELNMGVTAPIFRDSFLFENPSVQIHRPPAVGFWGSVGGGFTFP